MKLIFVIENIIITVLMTLVFIYANGAWKLLGLFLILLINNHPTSKDS